MKYLLFPLSIFVLGVGYFVHQQWIYSYSAQYRLDQLIKSGQKEFSLKEILGDDWKSVCFLPRSYGYYHRVQIDKLSRWLTHVLGRPVDKSEYEDMAGDGSGIRILFDDKVHTMGGLDGVPWRLTSLQEVICTHQSDTVIDIIRIKEGYKGDYWRGYWFKHRFEEQYKL